jgi:hypothetical protein
LHIVGSTRPPPWNATDVVVSVLNFPWQPAQAAAVTSSRTAGVPLPLGTK